MRTIPTVESYGVLVFRSTVTGLSCYAVKLHNVELTSIVDFGDAHDVTPLLLPVANPLALANDKHIREFALIVVRPLLPNSLARVEEASLASTEGADAGGEGLADHGGNEASSISRYGTYEFLP